MPPPLLVRRISLDALHRVPTAEETEVAAAEEAGTLAARLLRTREAMEAWLEEELYYFLLLDNFRPTTGSVPDLPARLHAGTADVRTALAEILLSTGFSLRNPGNDTFVTVVLEQCLGMEVQDRRNAATLAAGKRVYDGYEGRFLGGSGRTQADIVKLALADRRCTRHLLDRHHRRLFGGPLPETAEPLVDEVHARPARFFAVLAQWLGSPAYCDPHRPRRALSHFQFARSLYVDLLGRTPTYDELRMTRNAMLAMADPGPLRGVLVKIVLDSGKASLPVWPPGTDAAVFASSCFLRYLRREATADELAVFTAELRSAQRPDPVRTVRALLTSADYATY